MNVKDDEQEGKRKYKIEDLVPLAKSFHGKLVLPKPQGYGMKVGQKCFEKNCLVDLTDQSRKGDVNRNILYWHPKTNEEATCCRCFLEISCGNHQKENTGLRKSKRNKKKR